MPVGPFSPELMAQQYVLMEWGQGCSHMFIGIIREKISVELRTVYSLVSYNTLGNACCRKEKYCGSGEDK